MTLGITGQAGLVTPFLAEGSYIRVEGLQSLPSVRYVRLPPGSPIGGTHLTHALPNRLTDYLHKVGLSLCRAVQTEKQTETVLVRVRVSSLEY